MVWIEACVDYFAVRLPYTQFDIDVGREGNETFIMYLIIVVGTKTQFVSFSKKYGF